MRHKVDLLWAWCVWLITLPWPDIPLLMRARGALYGVAMARCGRNLQVGRNVTVHGLYRIDCGRDVYIASGCVLLIADSLRLGDEVMLAFHCVVTDGNHQRDEASASYRYGPRRNRPVVIGPGAWVGANATVMPGVTIGQGAVVGAGTTVTCDVPSHGRLVCAAARLL